MSKYALLEVERRFFVSELPDDLGPGTRIEDRYLSNLRIRLRRMSGPEGVVYKLTQKIPEGPSVNRITTFYLDAAEYEYLKSLPGNDLRKTRYRLDHEGTRWALDIFENGLVLAEVEIAPGQEIAYPGFIGQEVTADERYSGGSLARTTG